MAVSQTVVAAVVAHAATSVGTLSRYPSASSMSALHDALAPGEVGDRAREAEDPVVAPRRQRGPALTRRAAAATHRAEPHVPLGQPPVHPRVGEHAAPGEPLRWRSRAADTRSRTAAEPSVAGSSAARQRRNRIELADEVDPVEQRPAEPPGVARAVDLARS